MPLLSTRRRLIVALALLAVFETATSLPLPAGQGVESNQQSAAAFAVESNQQSTTSTVAVPPVAATVTPVPISSTPVKQVLEDEIWQYKYPPFNDFFETQASSHSEQVTSDEEEDSDSEQEPVNFLRDLPSYVIGIFNPLENDDSVRFESQPPVEQANPFQLFGSQQPHARQFQEGQNSFTIDDDLWIWKG